MNKILEIKLVNDTITYRYGEVVEHNGKEVVVGSKLYSFYIDAQQLEDIGNEVYSQSFIINLLKGMVENHQVIINLPKIDEEVVAPTVIE